MLVRKQVQLTELQERELRRLSLNSGKSTAELIRISVDQMLAKLSVSIDSSDDPWERAEAAIGAFSSDGPPGANVSSDHDRYLADIYLPRESA